VTQVSGVPLINPIFLSPLTLRTSSVSLRLALNGKKSLSRPKLDPEKDRPRCSGLGAVPSSSSRAVNESSESLEDLERNDVSSCSGSEGRESFGGKLIKDGILLGSRSSDLRLAIFLLGVIRHFFIGT
jgi:hypothetical protein